MHLKQCKWLLFRIRADISKQVFKLVSDKGSEFTSGKLKEYLLQNKITSVFSVPSTPQQNGFIERDMRTILESAETMLMNFQLPERFRIEGCQYI